MRKPLATLVLSAFLVGSFGCSSSVADTAPGGPSADQACSDLSALYCTRFDTCAPLFTQIAFADVASCKASTKSQCLVQLAAPSTGSSPQKQADCTAAAAGIACADLFANKLPDACRPSVGKLADGAACGDDAQCASRYCSTGDSAACGKCGAAPGAGASCSTQHCGPGLDCHKDDADKTGKTRTCLVPGDTGAACSATAPCREDLSCTDGKCGASAAKEGDACNFDGKAAPQCNLGAGLVCHPTTNKCIAIKLVGAGAPCGYDATAGTFTLCSNQGVCKKAKEADLTGTCVGGAALGAACNDDETVGPKCVAPGKCVAGTCIAPDPAACK